MYNRKPEKVDIVHLTNMIFVKDLTKRPKSLASQNFQRKQVELKFDPKDKEVASSTVVISILDHGLVWK